MGSDFLGRLPLFGGGLVRVLPDSQGARTYRRNSYATAGKTRRLLTAPRLSSTFGLRRSAADSPG